MNHILRQLDEAKAQARLEDDCDDKPSLKISSIETGADQAHVWREVIQSDQIHPDEIKKALNERGLQAGIRHS